MAVPPTDVSQLQWAVGLVASAATASIGWLWSRLATVETRLDARVSKHEDATRTTADRDLRDLWHAIEEDRRANAAFREKASEQLARLPTRDDLRDLETRLLATLARHP